MGYRPCAPRTCVRAQEDRDAATTRSSPRLRVRRAAARGCVVFSVASLAQEQGRREITLTAKRFEFSQTRIEVAANDVVKITLVAEDIPHSFTIDEYRISKRAAPGRPATFEFRADKAGTFPFYCNLTIDEGCRRCAASWWSFPPALMPLPAPRGAAGLPLPPPWLPRARCARRRGMRVKEEPRQQRRRGFREVPRPEAAHGADEGVGVAGEIEGGAIGPALVRP